MNLNALKSLRKTFDEVDEAEEVTDFLPDLPEDSVNNSSTSSYQKGVEGDVEEPIGRGPLALLELILKDPRRLDRLIREPAEQPELLFRLLAVCLVGFTFFGVSMSLVLSTTLVWPQLSAIDQVLASTHGSLIRFQGDPAANLSTPWLNGNALRLIAAYAIGLIGATGICLPSLYFYGHDDDGCCHSCDQIQSGCCRHAGGDLALVCCLWTRHYHLSSFRNGSRCGVTAGANLTVCGRPLGNLLAIPGTFDPDRYDDA